jgi:hypothetical protein
MARVARRNFLIAAGGLFAARVIEAQQAGKVARVVILAGSQAASPDTL